MKKSAYLFLAIVALAAASCSKNMNSASPSSLSVDQQKTIVASSTWRVTFFAEKGIIHTSDYNGYSFLFNSDGSLTVNGADMTFLGTWSLFKDNSKPDDSGHHSGLEASKMTITITGNSRMDEISDDWTIISLSDNEMALKDDNLLSGKEIRFSK